MRQIAVKKFNGSFWLVAMLALPSLASAQTSAAQPVTFTKDIAPIVFEHCASCHHPGGAGPFSVLSYDSARAHARQIADVTRRGYMPPWKPAPGSGPFVGENRLTTRQIDLLQRWAASGALEGTAQLPPIPKIAVGWQLGTPDLIVNLPPYTARCIGHRCIQDLCRSVADPGRTLRPRAGVSAR